jgi:two-component system, chemotaxis family, CheB/CheR fusion protein
LKALEVFLHQMPPDCGMAFVIVQHLDPRHNSLMRSLLTKQTSMPVHDIKDGTAVESGQVYIKPPGKDVVIRNQTLHLHEVKEKEGVRLPIDTFFTSLAEDQNERAIGIILSGAGSDGTLGAKLIKGEGGLVIAQDTKEAQYARMPQSVIDAGLADFTLPVEEIPKQLLRYVEHPFLSAGQKQKAEAPPELIESDLQSILVLVRANTGHDFSQYKRTTIQRRIERRMALHQIQVMHDYRRFLRQYPGEIQNLFEDLTINVTRFFRDPETFEALKQTAVRPLLQSRGTENPMRIWVPGCASGEEAYSIAIVAIEVIEETEKFCEIKIFGTDISNAGIQTARGGYFPENIAADVNQERLRRFFSNRGGRYQVDSKIRDMIIFAVHDVIRDPPFSSLDLVSCRNLLIYMDTTLQKKVLSIFHYALKPGGVLFLGPSETPGDASELFETLDKKSKIFRSRKAEAGHVLPFRMPDHLPKEMELPMGPKPQKTSGQELERRLKVRELVEQVMLKKYTYPAVLLDDQGDILYFHGNTGRYLSPPVGEPSFNVFNMVAGELHHRLSQSIESLKRERKPVQLENVQARHNDSYLSLDVSFTPVSPGGLKKDWVLVEFKEKETSAPSSLDPGQNTECESAKVAELEQRLRMSHQELQAAIEELETSNEELKSANEELQANNEELQSINEELESSKEELQSTNEELETVNSELSKKNQELMKADDDLSNLFATVEIGTLFLDNDLRIKRFTPAVTEVLNLKDVDLGRRISDITTRLQYENLEQDADEVLSKLIRKEIKVLAKSGKRYIMHIVPYRTKANVIEGVVMTFLDMGVLEKAELDLLDARSFFEATFSALWEPILVLDENYRVIMANRAFYRVFKSSPPETLDRTVFELGDRQWNIPDLRRFLLEIIPLDKQFEGYEVEHDFPRIGYRKMAINGRKIAASASRPPMILLSFKDITPGGT